MRKKEEQSNLKEFPKRDESSGLDKVRQKTARKRRVIFYRICIAVFLIGAALVGYFIYENTKVYEGYTIKSRVGRTKVAGTKVLEFDGGILSYSKNGAGAMDTNGKLLWNITFDMQNPVMSACNDTAAFADFGGNTIYIATTGGRQNTVKTDKPIRDIAVSSAGYVVAVLEDTSVTWLYMYDTNGKEIAFFRTSMEKSGYPVSVDISEDGELVAISYYYVDCDDITTQVAFYNFGSVGQNFIDNLVSGFNYADTMMPLVRFLDKKTAFGISQERLCIFEGAHKPVGISDMFISDEVLSVYNTRDAIAVIYRNGEYDNKYRMEVYSNTGKILSKKVFSFDYTGVSFGNGNVILYGGNDLFISTYNGETKYEGKYEDTISLVIATKDRAKYVIMTENSIDTVSFE